MRMKNIKQEEDMVNKIVTGTVIGELSFEMEVDGKKYTCTIGPEALDDVEPRNKRLPPKNKFELNENKFREVAERKIRTGKIESNGGVRIDTADI